MNQRNHKNQGFTLIELIVTVAIMAIFSGVVLSVVGTGAHSYRTTSGNAKVQMETQDIMDEIQNTIIDVNRSVYYSYGTSSSVGELVNSDIDNGATASEKSFFAVSGKESSGTTESGAQLYDYTCDTITWKSQEKKLYYSCQTWQGTETEKSTDTTTDGSGTDTGSSDTTGDASGNTTGSSETGTQGTGGSGEAVLDITDDDMEVADVSDGESENTTVSTRTTSIVNKVDQTLLAENVTDFRADISKAASEQIVRFQFTVNVNGKETTTVHTVNLRNQVQVAKPYEGYDKSDTTTPWILIASCPKKVAPGESVTGFAKIMNGNINPDSVTWVVESGSATFGTTAIGTDDSAVTLTANADASGRISIYVQARTTDGKIIQSRTTEIEVDQKKSYRVQLTDANGKTGSEIYTDETVTLTAELLNSENDTTDSNVSGVWTWSCVQGSGDNSQDVNSALVYESDNGKTAIFTPPHKKI